MKRKISTIYFVFQIDTGRLVEDTTALEKMYVEGTLAKLLVTSGNGELYFLIYYKSSGTEFEGAYCLIKTQTLLRFLLFKGSDACQVLES